MSSHTWVRAAGATSQCLALQKESCAILEAVCSIMLDASGVSHTVGLLCGFLYFLFPRAGKIDGRQMFYPSCSSTLPQSILRLLTL